MRQRKRPSLETEGFLLLIESSLSSIPFNVILAMLLSIIFVYNQVPTHLVSIWLISICMLSVIRWLNSKLILKNQAYKSKFHKLLPLFLFLTFLMGVVWGASYFVFLPYVSSSHEVIILLVLGGMSAGAMGSLSVYLPAYYAYVLPMFLPIIVYNFYLFQPDKVILAVMYSLFVIMILITAKISSHLLHTTFLLGKEKDMLINELTLTNLKLEKSIGEVRTLSITDSLTGLFNRRYFDMAFKNELGRARREQYPINLVFIDVDNFKSINDTYGHPKGDEFLIYIAETLKKAIRRSRDSIFRLGGDEFAAILSKMSSDEVLKFCATIQDLFNENNPYKNVTLSMGIIFISSVNVVDQQSIITAADKTLYQAKKAGKNMIVSKMIV